MENVRIWKANGPVKKAMGFGKEPVWFEIGDDTLSTSPVVLSAWMHMLFNQSHYRIDENGLLHLVCVGVWPGNHRLMMLEFVFEKKDNALVLVKTEEPVTNGKWLSVKKQGRKA